MIADSTVANDFAHRNDESANNKHQQLPAVSHALTTNLAVNQNEHFVASDEISSNEQLLVDVNDYHVSSTMAISDQELIKQGEEHISQERYLVASKLFRMVQDTTLLLPKHHRFLEMADQIQDVLNHLLAPPAEDGWKKQGESHGHRDTLIYYKVDKQNRLTCRIETPIEESILIPILSVFNESDLFHTWMPSWKHPKLGISASEKLLEQGRGNQVIRIAVDMPMPFSNREIFEHVFAADDIDESSSIIIKAQSLGIGTFDDRLVVPEPGRGVVRVDLDAGFLIRSCPPNHPALEKSKAKYPEDEKLLLLSLSLYVDSHVGYVPQRMVNFFTRTVVGTMWGSMLQVAEEVRSGERPAHKDAIDSKAELYKWVEQRVQVMLGNIEQ